MYKLLIVWILLTLPFLIIFQAIIRKFLVRKKYIYDKDLLLFIIINSILLWWGIYFLII